MRTIDKLLITTSCLATLFAAPAMAQDVAPADQNAPASDTIVVTGSRITRPNTTAAAPITSITAEAIKFQAAVNIEDVLNRLPQVAPDSQQNYQDSDGRQRVKLRNLGFERTLVLVDGKRLGTMNGEDVGMIPTALLKRTDVLTGGASAVYGSDAIAGVINFVMDRDFTGIRLDSNYNFYVHQNTPGLISQVAKNYSFAQPAHGLAVDGGRADIALTVGKKLFDDRLHLQAYANYRQGDLVPYSARETAGCQLIQSAKDGPLTCSTSTYTKTGYVSPRSGPNSGNAYVNNPDGSRSFVPYSTAQAMNPYDGYSFQRNSHRWNAGGFAQFEISDAATLYTDAMWFRDKSVNLFPARVYSYTAIGSSPYIVKCNNPFLSAAQSQVICGSNAGTSTAVPIELRYRFSGVPDGEDTYINQGLRISSGVRGTFADGWSYDVGGVYARNRQDFTTGALDYARVNKSLDTTLVNGVATCASGTADGCVPFDPFSAYAKTNNQALYNYLTAGTYGTSTTTNTLYQGIATVQGDLGKMGIKSPWAEQGLAVAFSAEYREDKLKSYADPIFREWNGGNDANYGQHVWEGMAEVQAPIVEHKPFAETLQFNGAFRLSKYNTNPKTFSTWKTELVWAPIKDITFRGSVNRAQRAPTVVQIAQAGVVSYGRAVTTYSDPCGPTLVSTTTDPKTGQQVPVYGAPKASRAACKATGLADSLYGSSTLLCPTDVGCTFRTGGFTVDPETAYTKTIGVVLRPRFLPGLTLSADRYLIDLNNSIDYNDYNYFSSGCAQTASDFFCKAFVRNADGTLSSDPKTNPTTGFIRQGTTNYYKSKAHGWDFQAQYALRLGDRVGKLDFDFNGSLATMLAGQGSPTQPVLDCAGGYYGDNCGQLIPKWSHTLRGTYTTPNQKFQLSLNWRYLGPLTNTTNSGIADLGGTAANARTTFYRISPYNYFDLAANFRVNEIFAFRISANNILDKDPPILANSYNYGLSRNNTLSARYDSLGRQVAVGATVKF